LYKIKKKSKEKEKKKKKIKSKENINKIFKSILRLIYEEYLIEKNKK
jgi:hypothetical protein